MKNNSVTFSTPYGSDDGRIGLSVLRELNWVSRSDGDSCVISTCD